jgi:hypothetical protein
MTTQEKPRTTQEKPRMTDAQRAALRDVCGRYHVEFCEDHYFRSFFSDYFEGWVGGSLHAAGNPRSTIYVGVSPEGRVNS